VCVAIVIAIAIAMVWPSTIAIDRRRWYRIAPTPALILTLILIQNYTNDSIERLATDRPNDRQQ